MKIKHIHIVIAIAIIIGGGIGLASRMDLFDTSRSAEPIKLTEDAYDIADIRGSFTLEEIETFYQVPPEAIIEAFNLETDTDPASFQLKDLKEIYQPVEIAGEEVAVETDSVKVFVSLYSDVPYASEETFYLPESAVDYLVTEDKLTPEEEDYWTKHVFDLASTQINNQISEIAEDTQDEPVVPEVEENVSITGRMTVAEVLAMGIEPEIFKEITGFDVPEDRSIAIRDFFASQDLEFSAFKEKMESFLSSGNSS